MSGVLTVIRRGAPTGGASGRSQGPYTGEIWRDMLHEGPDVVAGEVFFTPCARTYWHSHPGGQLLVVVSGEGVVVDADGPVRVTAGDMIWTPPDVRHWHGATVARSMSHTAVTFGGVDWQDEVPEADYRAAAG